MSADSINLPRTSLSKANDYTNEIHYIFKQHSKTLNKERETAIENIDKWYNELNERIKKYVEGQKELVNNHYNTLQPIFERKYIENLEIADSYHRARQGDPFNELCNACRSLKLSLAALKSIKMEMDYIEVKIEEKELETKNLDEKNIARVRRRYGTENTKNITNTSTTSSSHPITTDSDQNHHSPPSNKEFENKTDPSTINTDDSADKVTNADQPDNKCPICYMIFPVTMTRGLRRQHVNEHYTDD